MRLLGTEAFPTTDAVEAYVVRSVWRPSVSLDSVAERQLESGRWVRMSDRKTSDGGVVGIRTDITDLKTREAELEKQTRITALSQ